MKIRNVFRHEFTKGGGQASVMRLINLGRSGSVIRMVEVPQKV